MKLLLKFQRGIKQSRYSLSGKLVVLFILMAVVFVVLVGSGFRYFIKHHFKDNVQPHIVQYLEYVQNDIGSPPDTHRARLLAEKLNIEIYIVGADRGHWSSHRRRLDLSDLEIEHTHIINNKKYSLVEVEDEEDDFEREYVMTTVGNTTILFTIPHLEPERRTPRGWIPFIILLVVLLLLYYSTRRLFSPIDTIKEGVRRFGQGDLDHRINTNRKDELGELATSFNAMADELQHMLDAKRQLLLAISHELRSPLTRAKVATALIDNETSKGKINEDLDEMEKLIEELLETERLSTKHQAINKTPQILNKLAEEVVASYFKNDGVTLNLPENKINANVDTARFKLLLKNLIDNAIRHTPESSQPPEVTLTENNEEFTLQVKDYGTGIDAEHLPHLTEPFYRADPARQRETGGYGIGLYLCKMIAEAHNGSLSIESTPNEGTQVMVKVPK